MAFRFGQAGEDRVIESGATGKYQVRYVIIHQGFFGEFNNF